MPEGAKSSWLKFFNHLRGTAPGRRVDGPSRPQLADAPDPRGPRSYHGSISGSLATGTDINRDIMQVSLWK
jgi:hypothetical protein